MNKLLFSLLLGLALSASAVPLTPFAYYGSDPYGNPVTNAITIEPWPQTNAIVGVGTNLIITAAQVYYPDTNGYASGSLAAGNYRLTVAGQSRGITFGITASTNTQNLAQVAGVPVVTFLNFTLAQFSDAGTAAYSNSTAFFPAGSAGTAAYSNSTAFFLASAAGTAAYSNVTAFALATHDQALSTVTNAGTAAYSNATAFALATHNQPVSTITNAGTAAYSNTAAFALASHTHVYTAITDGGATNALILYTANEAGDGVITNTITFTNGFIRVWTQ